MSSRLFDEIRERRGLAYAVYSSLASYCDAGSLMIYAGTAPAQAAEVLGLVDVSSSGWPTRARRPTSWRWPRATSSGSYLLGLEDPGSRMARLGAQLTCLGRLRTVDETVAGVPGRRRAPPSPR